MFFYQSEALYCCNDTLICQVVRINRTAKKYLFAEKFLSLNPEELKNVKAEIGGTGISWNESLIIPDSELYEYGTKTGLRKTGFPDFVFLQAVNTAGAADIPNCSGQNINNLIKRGKLKPVKEMGSGKLSLKSDILKRRWQ